MNFSRARSCSSDRPVSEHEPNNGRSLSSVCLAEDFLEESTGVSYTRSWMPTCSTLQILMILSI